MALAVVAQWIECQPVKQGVAASTPSQGTCLGCRPGPQWGSMTGNCTLNSLLLFLLPFPCKNK